MDRQTWTSGPWVLNKPLADFTKWLCAYSLFFMMPTTSQNTPRKSFNLWHQALDHRTPSPNHGNPVILATYCNMEIRQSRTSSLPKTIHTLFSRTHTNPNLRATGCRREPQEVASRAPGSPGHEGRIDPEVNILPSQITSLENVNDSGIVRYFDSPDREYGYISFWVWASCHCDQKPGQAKG